MSTAMQPSPRRLSALARVSRYKASVVHTRPFT